MINNFFKIKNLEIILISLFPASLVIGPFIAETLMNLFTIIFIVKIIKAKSTVFFKNYIFYYLILFYLFLIFCVLKSQYFSETYINIFTYVRFILFAFAIYFFLNNNYQLIIYLYYTLIITLIILYLDSLLQFITYQNILGYPKYRIDRISSFFNDDLILGSFLMRITPILFWFSIFFINSKKISSINLILIFINFCVIFLSGERAPFILTIFYISILFVVINISFKIKFNSIIILIALVFSILYFNPTLYDRYYKQLSNHLFEKNDTSISFLPEYLPMFKTSIKMFNENKIFGLGPKSYRYACKVNKFETFFDKENIVDNTIIRLPGNWKDQGKRIKIQEFYIAKDEKIYKGDLLLRFKFINTKNNKDYSLIANYDFILKNIIKKNQYLADEIIFEVEPVNIPNKIVKKQNACNTHPHNYYVQLLAETGLVGFIFVLSLFVFITLIVLKRFLSLIAGNEDKHTNLEIVLLVGFIIYLWPFTTSGNFFNNWINMLNFYPLGFYLFSKKKKNKNINA